jgi:hypothetical protein
MLNLAQPMAFERLMMSGEMPLCLPPGRMCLPPERIFVALPPADAALPPASALRP